MPAQDLPWYTVNVYLKVDKGKEEQCVICDVFVL